MHLRREILIRDFNKRELKVLELILQLTCDCEREYAQIQLSEFAVIGISKHHIQEVLIYLQQRLVIEEVIDDNTGDRLGYRLNPTVADWQVDSVSGYNSNKFKRLFYPALAEGSTASADSIILKDSNPQLKLGRKKLGSQNGKWNSQNRNSSSQNGAELKKESIKEKNINIITTVQLWIE